MPLFRHVRGCPQTLLICAALLTGCSSTSKQARIADGQLAPVSTRLEQAAAKAATGADAAGSREPALVHLASHEEPDREPSVPAGDGADLFSGQTELHLPQLIEQVQARNPSLQAALSAWGAAS